MKNKRIIYWGGNDHTIIPRMGACGEGVDVESGGAGGSGGGVYTAMENTASPFTIGLVGGVYMNGNIDEVSMFNTELSASEVLGIYNGGSPNNLVSHAGLIGYWRNGDSGVFPNINDNSSNSNNGTCTNMVSSDFQNLIP